MEKIQFWAEIQPGLKIPARFEKPNRARIFSPVKRGENVCVSWIGMEFQPRLKSELGHAQWLCFQWNKMAAYISSRAEIPAPLITGLSSGLSQICHVIGP